MAADEMIDSLEFDQQISAMLSQDNGQLELLKFMAKETRNVNIRVSQIKVDFDKLFAEHNERIKSGASCSTEVNVNNVLPSSFKRIVALLGGGGFATGAALAVFIVGKIAGWW